MKDYLFVLGRNFELSKTEILNFCDEIYSDKEKALFIGKNLRFENLRALPKSSEQLFLDRLGGTIRFGEILTEVRSKKEILNLALDLLNKEEKRKIGFSVFGAGKDAIIDLIVAIKSLRTDKNESIRVENFQMKNLTSGQIFDRKILQKGIELLIWKKNDTYLVARTVANQNLRNYKLRDREKVFRDAKMGMLPPKLAQILLNLADPKPTDIVYDPFCGSGTLNIEAAILGYKTKGSDINPDFVRGSERNFSQMGVKFRFDSQLGNFKTSDALDIQWQFQKEGVIATEGYLGINYDTNAKPNRQKLEENKQNVTRIWTHFFKNLKKSNIKKIAFCLPCWNFKGEKNSISQKIFAIAAKNRYISSAVFGNDKTFIYERNDTFVAREICVMKKED
jgi:tRNA G10  N-methylase Trm11